MRPMLATAVDTLPTRGSWLHEVKWDGMRLLIDVHDGQARLFSRTEADVTVTFPELVGLAGRVEDALLDGEVVALVDGRPSFAALAERMHVRDPRRARRLAQHRPVTYMAFDLLRLYGVDLTGRAVEERRATLERLGLGTPGEVAWQVPPSYDDGPALLSATAEQGLEGVVSKRRGSPYQPGRRSRDWTKLPHRTDLSVVVGGWRPEEGSGPGGRLSSLLVGLPDGAGGLLYLGKVGSGLTGGSVADLTRLLAPLAAERPPFDEVPKPDAQGTVWVEPQVVVDVRYLGRTGGGRLRQPVVRGLRTDLTVEDVAEQDVEGAGRG